MGIFDLFQRGKGVPTNMAADFPYPFGYKICWYAIKNETAEAIIEKLKFKVVSESNWETGIKNVYESEKHLFVSPPVNGYVLVVNVHPDENAVKKHSLLFKELQYFATHRVIEYNAWAKFCDGKIIRGYGYTGESGEVTWCEGNVTQEEINLGFEKFPANTEELCSDDFDYENLPDEESVLAIAKAWGVDVAFEDDGYEKGTGFLCEFM
ncbi:MAG: hypothetical protein FWB96_11725 [Defluviitaleaceae bacterium]|nr:hypothetical protein [Defluviitaleaceae bacterium]MCL2263763.1 hypothetical protein [Defluviitaleaceae bacterium]